ncbi:MAG: hypothetical protein A2X55_09035 [Nitrospirae bacterium GWB2_47_37]|nr:MAG: hypothetical protein A2Z82_02535 [Nitrospirae bacterium GWA2_46_11]OGW23109.1 MAG: hypothetical protein A2X55_09035 [Nitrospirae bacterium GWB2_47_37]HAK87655.1 hypothetical protein [Nitrospiraceae bacterium]
MANGKKKLTKEERIKINQQRAQEPFAQVIMRPEHVDGRVLYDISGALSKGIKVLRNVMGHRVSFADAEVLLTRTKNIEIEANKLAKDIFAAIDFEYKEPRALQQKAAASGDIAGSKTEKAVDSKMDMAYAAGTGETDVDGKVEKKAAKKA